MGNVNIVCNFVKNLIAKGLFWTWAYRVYVHKGGIQTPFVHIPKEKSKH